MLGCSNDYLNYFHRNWILTAIHATRECNWFWHWFGRESENLLPSSKWAARERRSHRGFSRESVMDFVSYRCMNWAVWFCFFITFTNTHTVTRESIEIFPKFWNQSSDQKSDFCTFSIHSNSFANKIFQQQMNIVKKCSEIFDTFSLHCLFKQL